MYEVWHNPSITMLFEGTGQELYDFLSVSRARGGDEALDDLWIINQKTRYVFKDAVLWVGLWKEVAEGIKNVRNMG